jgi:hypothetical protein
MRADSGLCVYIRGFEIGFAGFALAFEAMVISHDANGNRTGAGYTTAAGNELTASPGFTYT